MKKVSIISYGSGNIYSIYKAISDLGYVVEICKTPNEIDKAERIILPGVGSFYESMKLLTQNNWIEKILHLVKDKKIPIFGICLGMQLLSKCSYEDNYSPGLNLIEGEVSSLKELGCQKIIPHMGWNAVIFDKNNKLFKDISLESDFYFAHSYAFKNIHKDYVSGTVNYGVDIVAAISFNNILGTQFHPEKSSLNGKKILKNFIEYY
jgi:glutamine amidotransferase